MEELREGRLRTWRVLSRSGFYLCIWQLHLLSRLLHFMEFGTVDRLEEHRHSRGRLLVSIASDLIYTLDLTYIQPLCLIQVAETH